MLGLGTTEMIITLVLFLIIFGTGKLPAMAGKLGRCVRSFREAASGDDIIDITPKNGD